VLVQTAVRSVSRRDSSSPVGLDFEESSEHEVAAEHKVSLGLRDVL
jgi:hypothetical protein